MKSTIPTVLVTALALGSVPAYAHTSMPKGSNIAEKFCINKGGTLKAVGDEKLCVLPNGSEVKPDDLLRGKKAN